MRTYPKGRFYYDCMDAVGRVQQEAKTKPIIQAIQFGLSFKIATKLEA